MIVSASRTPYHLRLAAAGRVLRNGLQSTKKEHRVSFKNRIFGITFSGTRITKVATGSQASKLGVQVGWTISAVNNQVVTDENVSNIIKAAKAAGGPTIEVAFQGTQKRQ